MDILNVLNESLVLVGVSMWLQLHATPIAWVFALGLVVVALLVIRELSAAATSAVVFVPASATRRPPHLRTDAVASSPATLTLGARGPRAPGQRMPRPALSH